MMYDPGREGGRGLDGVDVLPELAPDADRASASAIESLERALARIGARAAAGRVLMVASGTLAAEGKIRGIAPDLLEALGPGVRLAPRRGRRLEETPRQGTGPGGAGDALRRRPRPGLRGTRLPGRDRSPPVRSTATSSSPVSSGRLRERRSPQPTSWHWQAAQGGLFKAAPPAARRIVALNKADLLPAGRLDTVLDAFDGASAQGIDLVAACRFAAPSDRVVAVRRGIPRPDVPVVE